MSGLRTGLDGQIGYKQEATYGTAVTVDRFLPIPVDNPPALKFDPGRVRSNVIRAGRVLADVDDAREGNKRIALSAGHVITDNSIGLLLKLLFGAVSTTGAGPYVHTFTPVNTGLLPSATIQLGMPGTSGTVHPFTLSGAKANAGQLRGQLDQPGTVALDWICQDLTTATALASASFGAADTLLTYVQGTCTIGGTPPNVVKSFALDIGNNLAGERFTAGSRLIKEPYRAGKMAVTGTIDVEFEDLTAFNRVVNHTYADIVLGFTDTTNSLLVTVHASFDAPGDPAFDGEGPLTQTLTFTAEGDGSDSDGLTAVLTNADATP